jgi:hypothetical protein
MTEGGASRSDRMVEVSSEHSTRQGWGRLKRCPERDETEWRVSGTTHERKAAEYPTTVGLHDRG